MIIIFLGTVGIYHPVLAAHHYLTGDRIYGHHGLKAWGDFSREKLGDPILVGQDHYGNQVYALGAGPEPAISRKMIEQMIGILGRAHGEVIIRTITVRTDKVLLYLYRMGAVRMLRNPINTVVRHLLRGESPSLWRQVDEFIAQTGFLQ